MGADERDARESRIDRWKASLFAAGEQSATVVDAERRLREQLERLGEAGLDEDEAFLIASRRVGAGERTQDDLSRAAEPSPAAQPLDEEATSHAAPAEFWVMLVCAAVAAVAVKVPALFGLEINGAGAHFYARNLSLFALPFLAGYFVWKRGLSTKGIVGLAALFVAGAVFANAYPFTRGGSTEMLTSMHLPIALWLAVGVAYVGGDWRAGARRMEYVRFTGEWLVNYALIALGGGVLVGITVGVFGAIGIDASKFITEWALPCGAMGAVVVAAWLIGLRRNPAGGLAPMLARVFTPLFTLMLVALLTGVVGTRGVIDVAREVLILFDVLLVVVLALVLYAISARDAAEAPRPFDWIQIVLVGCALGVDVFALVNIAFRLTEYGFSANKTAALGLNLILLVNLAWSAVLQARFLRSRRGFDSVERWQMRYLPIYALWALAVVIGFPPLFGFI